MKTVKIRCGSKKSARTPLMIEVQRAETIDECMALADGTEATVVAAFNRALDIARIDRIGRPAFEAGDKDETIIKDVQAYKLGVTRGRTTKEPVKVELPKGQKTFTAAEVAALLAAKGIIAEVAAK